jgi:hypothetical protein
MPAQPFSPAAMKANHRQVIGIGDFRVIPKPADMQASTPRQLPIVVLEWAG